MNTLFLIRGLPGAGKSFLANLLSENGKYPVHSADAFFEDDEGNYNWDPRLIKDAHAWCLDCVRVEMNLSAIHDRNHPDIPSNLNKIFVANTFTQEWEMEPYFQLAEKYGYNIVTMIVENRHGGKNVHDVPDEPIKKMRDRFSIQL